eukprot:Hpha_TRINITY_DN32527_c0_g1::TRINITY_DN32527_c0_g1_i1::g.24461::m.24461
MCLWDRVNAVQLEDPADAAAILTASFYADSPPPPAVRTATTRVWDLIARRGLRDWESYRLSVLTRFAEQNALRARVERRRVTVKKGGGGGSLKRALEEAADETR